MPYLSLACLLQILKQINSLSRQKIQNYLKKHARTGENNNIALEITAYKLRGKK
jgi:hypothetical protein